jgi:WD repeat-containing protein mio
MGGLVEGAVETLLDSENYSENDSEYGSRSTMDAELHCPIYSSPGRLNVLEVCGWAPCLSELDAYDNDDDNDNNGNNNNNSNNNGLSGDMMNDDRLQHLIEECEGAGDIDRACCLAIFHGDLTLALSVLTNAQQAHELEDRNEGGPLNNNNTSSNNNNMDPASIQEQKDYQLRQVVAMCIAGYSATPNQRWMDMCRNICGNGYLRQICTFLYHISLMTLRGTDEARGGEDMSENLKSQQHHHPPPPPMVQNNHSHNSNNSTATSASSSSSFASKLQDVLFRDILLDDEICLEDRLAFSSRFLPHFDLISFLEYETQLKSSRGDLEGFMLLGFRQAGIDLLQNYLDQSGDVQTVALLCSHVEKDRLTLMEQRGLNSRLNSNPSISSTTTSASNAPSSSSNLFATSMNIIAQGDKQLNEWIECYRDLLDGWQLWKQRATFDVGRAALIRGDELQQQQQGGGGGGASAGGAGGKSGSAASGGGGGDGDAGLFIRCNFCNAAITLSVLSQQTTMKNKPWLSNQKPILGCCPSCRNFLPKCYVCLLSLSW